VDTDGNCGSEQRDQSMLTFETSSVQGAASITEKLIVCSPPITTNRYPGILTHESNQQSLPFQQVRHQIATFDAQPSSEGGIIVLVTGALIVRPQSLRHKKHTSL